MIIILLQHLGKIIKELHTYEESMDIQKLCIIGGGHAGWWTAGYFEKNFPKMHITLIESDNIPILGVGESTLPQVKIWFDELGINENDWMKKSHATIKYGNTKENWIKKNGYDEFTYYFWQNDNNIFDKLIRNGINKNDLQKEFSKPQGWRDYAYHLDANYAASIVKNYCKKVNHVIADLNELPKGYDLYIDCTGFSRKFITDKTSMKLNKNHYVDSAIVCPIEKIKSDDELMFTKSIARKFGWQFYIPLTSRVGTGYIFSSKHVEDDDAMLEFLQMIDGRKQLIKPRIIKWNPSVLSRPWQNNIVAIGSSAGFVDPLESVALSLTQIGITTLAKCLSKGSESKVYNRLMNKIWNESLDFQSAQYALSRRRDTKFWYDVTIDRDYWSKKLWEKYSTKTNKFNNLFSSGIWAELGTYLDDFKYYRVNIT